MEPIVLSDSLRKSELPLWYVMQTNPDGTRIAVKACATHLEAYQNRESGKRQWMRSETHAEMQARLATAE